MTPRVREILDNYGSDNPGTLANLARLLNHGRLGGTGKLVILPVDQGFEHGPGRSFGPNPPAYDPRYHFELAIEAGCNAYAAPLGFLEAGAREFAGEIPLILKANDHDLLMNEKDPNQALTGSVADALRLGCAGIGFTIYPGSEHRLEMYEQIRAYAAEAKRHGLAVIIWSYPRGSQLSKEGETSIDVCGYAAHIAAQLGAHIIKVKIPSAHIEQEEARKVYETYKIRYVGRPHQTRGAVLLRWAADRDLLRRHLRKRRKATGRGAGRSGRRRIRLHHRPQLLPAPRTGSPRPAPPHHGYLRRIDAKRLYPWTALR
jgi:class I fructose-bisphosphate aldolase